VSTDYGRVGPFDDTDRYELIEHRSRGGQADLWLGRREFGRIRVPVAIKIFRPRRGSLAELERAGNEEVELLRCLDHPNLPRVREFFAGPDPHQHGEAKASTRSLYLVMNWVEGTNLDEWIAEDSNRTVADILDTVERVADALDYLHGGRDTEGVQVVHRDVSPDNVIIKGRDVKLVDFSLARLLGGKMTFGGKPSYLAPEVLERGEFGPPSDLYALAVTACFALLGGVLPEGRGTDAIRRRLGDHLGPTGLALVNQLMTGLEPEPTDRPSSAKAWARELRHSAYRELATPILSPSEDPTAQLDIKPRLLVLSTPAPRPSTAPSEVAAMLDSDSVPDPIPVPATWSTSSPIATPPPGRKGRTRSNSRSPLRVLATCLLGVGVGLPAGIWVEGRTAREPDPTTTTPAGPIAPVPTTIPVPRTMPFPSNGSTLAPGRYRSTTFAPPFEVAIIDANWKLQREERDLLELTRVGNPQGAIQFVNVTKVYGHTLGARARGSAIPFTGDQVSASVLPVGALPEGLEAWLANHPDLGTKEGPATFGNLQATRSVEATVTNTYSYEGCRVGCVLLFQLRRSADPDAETYPFTKLAGEQFTVQVESGSSPAGNGVIAVVSVGQDRVRLDQLAKLLRFERIDPGVAP